jgi:hypothetical protein
MSDFGGMSFFTEPKNAGLALIIVAILNIIAGIVGVYDGATNGFDTGVVVAAVGTIICAIVILLFGMNLKNGMFSKIEIVSNYVKVIGVTTIIGGIFFLGYLANGVDGVVVTAIVTIIFGLIIMWCASKIGDGKVEFVDKIIWIILVLIMILCILTSIVSLLDFFVGTIIAICDIIIYVFMLLLLLDGDVKSKMGM